MGLLRLKPPVSRELTIVFVLSVMMAVLASPKLTSQILQIPKDHVFIGMTTYFEDFYYYLDQFYQGKAGNWLTENRFSIERFAPTLVYFNHILLGKIGGLVGLESFQSYNLFGFLFKWLFIYLAYWPIRYLLPTSWPKRIAVYLVFLFSTAVPRFALEGGKLVYMGGYDAFRAENRIMARFGTAPNGMLINLTFLAGLAIAYRIANLITGQKSVRSGGKLTALSILFVVLTGYLTLTDASKALILLVFTAAEYWFMYRPRVTRTIHGRILVTLAAAAAIFLIVAAVIFRTVESDPVYAAANEWDVRQYLSQIRTDFKGLLFGFGFQLPFLVAGYASVWRKKEKTVSDSAVLLLVGISLSAYLLPMVFQVPVPGFRFMFPALYPFFAALVVTGMETAGRRLGRPWAFPVLVLTYLCISITSFSLAWYRDTRIPDEPDYHFTYMPKKLYEGLVFLRTAQPLDGNVLASPYTSTDLMIPGLTGRYTYSGHMLTTYDSVHKDEDANGFFYTWTDSFETRNWLRDNNIRFIVVTKYSAVLDHFRKMYPLILTPVFSNEDVTIFRYDP